MARKSRQDEPGSWHHVMNRGIARRTVFETREDVRYLLSRLAHAVRRGDLEVHAYCVMTTHYHLLVRSPSRRLSEAMRRVQNEYVRRFNRMRKRDGPLFRGRFLSKPVETAYYRRVLVRYIDTNPVSAGIVPTPHLYAHGSARHYNAATGPPWLERSWIETVARAEPGATGSTSHAYRRAFAAPLETGLTRLVEQRIASSVRGPDPFDDLVHAAPDEVLTWMRRKARLADGTRPGLAICDAGSIGTAIERGMAIAPDWRVRAGRGAVDAWPQVHAGLLRELAGLPAAQVAPALGRTTSAVFKLHQRYRAMLCEDEDYGRRARAVAVAALEIAGVRRSADGVGEWS